MIYLIVVNYHSTQLVEKLVAALETDRHLNWQLIIVNNSPEDGSIHRLQDDLVTVLEPGLNLGFGRACNVGLNWIYQRDRQAIVWLINPDAYPLEESILKAYHFFDKHPDVSIPGTAVYQPNGEVWFGCGHFDQETGIILAMDNLNTDPDLAYEPMDWVTGCSFLINLRNFHECPSFDEDYFLYYEDFDFCWRYNQQGHKICMTHKIGVVHHPSSITGKHPNLKLEHSIYSYLLTLEKHTSKLVLYGRLLRIAIASLLTIPMKFHLGMPKLKGVWRYCQRLRQAKN